ncbi:MAG: ammonia-forming cytochrome c nitrite reductase subunit c552, partial [Candidatus Bathyarchaeia archaeon]
MAVHASPEEGRLEGYVGADTCILCHRSLTPEIVEKWNSSQHARVGNASARVANAYPLSRGISCAGCHATNYDPDTGTYTDPYQGCEACHGPGATHIAGPTKENIFKPDSSSVCGQCHNRHGESLTYTNPETGEPVGYPVGYTPDKPLEEYYQSASLDDEHSFWPTGHASYEHGGGGMQYPEWKQSRHAEVGVECFICHDPHGPTGNENNLISPQAELCALCHKPQEKMNAGMGGVGVPEMPWVMEDMCVNCHMPSVGLDYKGDPGDGRSHTWTVLYPAEASEHGVYASSCSDCHATSEDPLGVRFQTLIDDRRAEIAGIIEALETEMKAVSFDTAAAEQLESQARRNMDMVKHDESSGWHNYYYALSLLNEAGQLLEQAADVDDHLKANADLQSQLSNLEGEKATLEDEVSSLESQVSDLEAQVSSLQGEVESWKAKAAGGTTNMIIGAVAGLIIGA